MSFTMAGGGAEDGARELAEGRQRDPLQRVLGGVPHAAPAAPLQGLRQDLLREVQRPGDHLHPERAEDEKGYVGKQKRVCEACFQELAEEAQGSAPKVTDLRKKAAGTAEVARGAAQEGDCDSEDPTDVTTQVIMSSNRLFPDLEHDGYTFLRQGVSPQISLFWAKVNLALRMRNSPW
eukprot:CAMPEP_0179286246 /NCGR_PEP_ID=MMETSP0797-20121207/39640_1 /TAXON_ID=47934 /ORGANISM="Dinophysis acuminata, Strain DAEP01" /LENGTH=177 /DNA_ID=CAMNT_0020995119 /DNA_START=52 /DNA_END=585 /DNA_ORIENTATION=+